jgi:6-phosphogluconolactonase
MTLTLRTLLDSRWIALLIKGEAKMTTYRAAERDGDVAEMPVRAILGQSAVPVDVFWSP